MTDARLKSYASLEGVTMDLLLRETGELDEREELATAGRVALGTDRLADSNEVLPDLDSTDRRGWWGDFEAEEIWGGWPIGTKNWLLTRAKITEAPSVEGSTLQRAQRYTLEALQPFVQKSIASQMTVDATRSGLERIDVDAKIYRGPLEEIALRYQILWQEEPVFQEVTIPLFVNYKCFGFALEVGSLALGTPVFLTNSPVHLPPVSLTVSSPQFGDSSTMIGYIPPPPPLYVP